MGLLCYSIYLCFLGKNSIFASYVVFVSLQNLDRKTVPASCFRNFTKQTTCTNYTQNLILVCITRPPSKCAHLLAFVPTAVSSTAFLQYLLLLNCGNLLLIQTRFPSALASPRASCACGVTALGGSEVNAQHTWCTVQYQAHA